jgi:hypothetical protein
MEKDIPANFRNVIIDFTTDLSTTFPEYTSLWAKWADPQLSEDNSRYLFHYCLSVFPERFFDLLYQNNEIFALDSQVNTHFLPDVDFKLLFHGEHVTENTKKSLWKYLQLLLFTIVGSTKDKASFGETMNMFDSVNEVDLEDKMKETMKSIVDFFQNMTKENTKEEEQEAASSLPKAESTSNPFENMFSGNTDIPNMGKIHDHLKTLFHGKIGSLAKEMAEEISGEFSDLLGEDMGDIHDTKDVIQKLMKNPKKIMELMKTVGTKLDAKMKSGEISKEEIMKEASDLFGSMKDMGDNKSFMDMFKNLSKMGGMPSGGMPKNSKVDTNAMNRQSKQQAMRERLRRKVEEKRLQQETLSNTMLPSVNYSIQPTTTANNLVFSLVDSESQEKSYIHPDILKEMEKEEIQKVEPVKSNKKKKNKKKNTA